MTGRRHHFIPRMILRNFCDESGQLWFCRRDFPPGVFKRAAPEKLFVETDLYSVVDEDGNRDDRFEQQLAELEDTGAGFLRRLLEIVRRGKLPQLDDGAWEFWRLFLYVHMKRSPRYVEMVAAKLGTWESIRQGMETLVSKGGEEAREARALLNDPAAFKRYLTNFRALELSRQPSQRVMEVLGERGMSIFRAPEGKSFVIGDIGFASANVRSTYAPSGSLMFVPVAPDVAVGVAMEADRVGLATIQVHELRSMNEAMVRQSRMIAGSSETLLRSLCRSFGGSVVELGEGHTSPIPTGALG